MGWDPREAAAFEVAEGTLFEHTSEPVHLSPLILTELTQRGVMRRPITMRGGQIWDQISEAPMSTEFAITRFLAPLLHPHGWSLFVDCDVVFEADVEELFRLADPRYAVMCVQHPPLLAGGQKMDGKAQLPYPRKNWSSVMLFNGEHPANRARLSLDLINRVPGRDLHAFCWLEDSQIGALPAEWNWLVGVQARPASPKLAHFTLGGPWLPGWKVRPHDELWLAAREDIRARRGTRDARASADAM